MTKSFALHLPINRVSFGQISTLLLRTLFDREKATGVASDIHLFTIGNVDLSSQNAPKDFQEWLSAKILNGAINYNRDIPCFKLWHLSDSMASLGRNQNLFSFYELDEPTKIEANIARNSKTYFSSKYSIESFKAAGVECGYIPLGFDSYNFRATDKKYADDGRVTFSLCGKFEKRKNHAKILQTWIKRFGNKPQYALHCALYNPFLNEQQNQQSIAAALGGAAKPFNVNLLPLMNENVVYNEFLNSADVVIGMSGAEGWGLPEFQSVAIGKHAVILNAHAYKEWATPENSVLVNPSGKTPAYDGVFFQKGQPFNQGSVFDFSEDEFIAGCEAAIKRVYSNKKNSAGLELQKTFSKENYLDAVLATL